MLMRILILLAVTTSVFAQGKSSGEKEFELVKESGSGKLYERWVVFPGSDPPVEAREVKGEFVIKNSPDHILEIIKGPDQISLWQKSVNEYRIIEDYDTAWTSYAFYDIPWPLNNQDHLLTYTLKKLSKGYIIHFKSVTDSLKAPVKHNVTRMVLAGSWKIIPSGKDQCNVTYTIFSMPGNIPRWLADPVIRGNLMSTIENLVKLSEKK